MTSNLANYDNFTSNVNGIDDVIRSFSAFGISERNQHNFDRLIDNINCGLIVLVHFSDKPFVPVFTTKNSVAEVTTSPSNAATKRQDYTVNLNATQSFGPESNFSLLLEGFYWSKASMVKYEDIESPFAAHTEEVDDENDYIVEQENKVIESPANEQAKPAETPMSVATVASPIMPPVVLPIPKQAPDEEENVPTNWLKIRAFYEDNWKTPLPLQNILLKINNAVYQTDIALNKAGAKSTSASSIEQAKQTANEAGVIVLEDLPEGEIDIEVERKEGLEREIQSLRDALTTRLDGAYRDTVTSMSGFQNQWDEYGYGAIALSGAEGIWDGGTGWANDQADLFEAETWRNLGDLIGEYAGKAYDGAAEYASDTYDNIEKTVNDTIDTLDENADNLTNWNWYAANAQEAIESAQSNINDAITGTKDYINDAAEYLGATTEDIEKLYKHRQAIMNLPTLISQGDSKALQDFIDNELMDIDPEMAKTIKDGPNFHLVLELIEDNQAALIYTAYLSLFIESIPPNFYAYIAGKGGIYIVIEIILLIVMSLLTLGVGTAARLTTLAAKLAASSAKAAGATNKLAYAQKAIKAVTRTVDDFMESAETLKALGQKLTVARSAGIARKASPKSTLATTKKNQKRDTKCRICGSDNHSTRRSKRGNIIYS